MLYTVGYQNTIANAKIKEQLTLIKDQLLNDYQQINQAKFMLSRDYWEAVAQLSHQYQDLIAKNLVTKEDWIRFNEKLVKLFETQYSTAMHQEITLQYQHDYRVLIISQIVQESKNYKEHICLDESTKSAFTQLLQAILTKSNQLDTEQDKRLRHTQ